MLASSCKADRRQGWCLLDLPSMYRAEPLTYHTDHELARRKCVHLAHEACGTVECAEPSLRQTIISAWQVWDFIRDFAEHTTLNIVVFGLALPSML